MKEKLCLVLQLENLIKMNKKTVFESTVTDNTTGEVMKHTVLKKKVKNTEHFYQLYSEDLGVLLQCTQGQVRFLLALLKLKYIEFNTNEIILSASRREKIAQEADLSIGAIYNILSNLKKKNIVVKEGKSILLNPKLFFSGYEIEREKMFRLSIDYEFCEEC